MRFVLLALTLLIFLPSPAQTRDRFTLYDERSGAPKRIKEGSYVDISLRPDRCPGWDTRNHGVGGNLLLVEDSSVTIFLDHEFVTCEGGDSSYSVTRTDLPEGGTMTIPNDRIISIDRGESAAAIASGVILGISCATVLFIAPIASISWFNGGEFNTERYTTMTTASLIALGVSVPLYAVLSGSRTLVPKTHVDQPLGHHAR